MVEIGLVIGCKYEVYFPLVLGDDQVAAYPSRLALFKYGEYDETTTSADKTYRPVRLIFGLF